ncbi:MAG: UDP-N-acetylmuramate dehydrogenase [Eubacteriales bacterium]|nr:UDP-N-acetylmuramate dehydrogenase [Eubacteriales bacterium]
MQTYKFWHGLDEEDFNRAKLKEGVKLADIVYYQAGGEASLFFAPSEIKEFVKALSWARQNDVKTTILGLGTNVLISPQGLSGLVISTANLNRLYLDTDLIWAEAGVILADLIEQFTRLGRCSAPGLVGIPGTVGGGLFMNAGAYDSELSAILDKILLYKIDSGECYVRDHAVEDFSYRNSFLQAGEELVLAAAFKPSVVDSENSLIDLYEYQKRRRQSQPLAMPSCGSAFKRPKGHFVGKLISDMGWKGHREGNVGVSAKHAGFIVNYGVDSSQEIADFFDKVKSEVLKSFNLELEEEVKFLGDWQSTRN